MKMLVGQNLFAPVVACYEQSGMQLKFGQRAFSYAAPACNGLPPTLQQIPNTASFKRHLKTYNFSITRLTYTVRLSYT